MPVSPGSVPGALSESNGDYVDITSNLTTGHSHLEYEIVCNLIKTDAMFVCPSVCVSDLISLIIPNVIGIISLSS